MRKQIVWFEDIGLEDLSLVGGKNASLGEMIRDLSRYGVNVPNGFALTSEAYFYFLENGKIKDEIKKILATIDINNVDDLIKKSEKIRKLILNTPFPKDLEEKILDFYRKLSREYKEENVDVAVRSSATAEDLPTASFAGMHESFLNIRGKKQLLEAIKKCFASLFLPRTISYREEKGFDHMKIALSAGVQKMVRSDLACSGVMFTLDTESGFPDVSVINGTWGLGEMIVKGKITSDEFFVAERMLVKGYPAIIKKKLGSKKYKMIRGKSKEGTKIVPTTEKERNTFVLSDEEVLRLADWAIKIEKHYSKKAGTWQPMDIEWAKDGKLNKLFIIQARPETIHRGEEKKSFFEYKIKGKAKILCQGIAIGQKIGQGKANVIQDIKGIGRFKKREILVTRMTDPDWEPIMKMASAIVTDEGSRTCFSGDTKIFTNKGFLSIKEVVENFKESNLKVLSLNKETFKLEWKRIKNGFKRKSHLIKINISQSGRMKNNFIKVTPDHKFFTFENRKLISRKIIDIVKNNDCIISIEKIPAIGKKKNKAKKELYYLLGGLLTDGYLNLGKNNSEIQFIQKRTPQKKKFIEGMNNCLKEIFGCSFREYKGDVNKTIIRGKIVNGRANRFRCYNRKIVKELLKIKENLFKDFLFVSEDCLFNFLAGVIDGDGTYNQKENRINIFCSSKELLDLIIICVLRLGINFQVTQNRNIYNIQIIDKIEEIFQYTLRVKGIYARKRIGTRFFNASQLLKDIVYKVNYKGRILAYVKNNLLIDAEKIRNFVIPKIKGEIENHELTKILKSPLKMLRVNVVKGFSNKSREEVFNIEVEDNHNYLVLTNKNTPVLVENCHAAIISRELGVPCVVGAREATKKIKSGKFVTIDCSKGENGFVYEGKVPFSIKEYKLKDLPKTKTKICLNIGTPESAFSASFLPVDGVGLAREEFIFTSEIRIHPLALLNFNKLDKKTKNEIEKITVGYKDKKDFFIEKLAQGIGRIATAFYPREVIVRFSDFKSNEYAQLVGGKYFEPQESNPMIGWRGASRYYSEEFKEAFSLECKAIKKVREEYGFENVSVMVPFCRTPEEGRKVLDIMKNNGLIKGIKGLKVYVMCEIPSNVILIEEFLDVFDGISIGSNDLTQLTLGIDRDSAILARIGDERDNSVKKLIKEAIETCNKRGKYCGICGDAPSTFPEFAKFLVECGIQSISVNPDVAVKTRLIVAEAEKRLRE